MMARPTDDEYYIDNRTQHLAQGDLFREVPFTWIESETGEPVGFEGCGMLITYTSGMMQQPPGSQGYKHSFRLVAPIFTFTMLSDMGLSDSQLTEIRRSDKFAAFMYLPAYPGEFEEGAVVPYRAALLEHDILEGRRITQLQRPAAVRLQMKLATTFLGHTWEPDAFDPDLTDHWNTD